MVRSRGSYCRTSRKESVVTATSAGSTGPAMRRFVEFPASAIVRPAAAASCSASANSAELQGANTLGNPHCVPQNHIQEGQHQRTNQGVQESIDPEARRK